MGVKSLVQGPREQAAINELTKKTPRRQATTTTSVAGLSQIRRNEIMRLDVYVRPWPLAWSFLRRIYATIRRNGNRVTISVHRKPTDTGHNLSFDSHHPVGAKRSTVSALLSRALSVVSDSTEQTAELDVASARY